MSTTEYGIKRKSGSIEWFPHSKREVIEQSVRLSRDSVLVAREVSEPRVVSIR